MAPPQPLKVIIVGAGIAGLTLASALRAKGILFEIYERDAHPDARPQGYAISLRWFVDELIKNAPPSASPFETTDILYGTGIEPSTIGYEDVKGPPLLEMRGLENVAYRCNRKRLRRWLMTDLDVRWGWQFERHEIQEDGRVKVHFKGGKNTIGDLLVGADGVGSHVRQYLYKLNPQVIPPSLHTVRLAIVGAQLDINAEQLQTMLKFGSTLTMSITDVKCMIGLSDCAQDLSAAKAYWIVAWPDDDIENPQHWLHSGDTARHLKEALNRISHLNPEFTKPILATTPEQVFNPPLVLRSMVPQHCPPGPVTLIGDSAHAMAPFRGEGGNNSISDALTLGDQLAKANGDIQAAVLAYEKSMIPRSEKSVRIAHDAAFKWGKSFLPSPEEALSQFSIKTTLAHTFTD